LKPIARGVNSVDRGARLPRFWAGGR